MKDKTLYAVVEDSMWESGCVKKNLDKGNLYVKVCGEFFAVDELYTPLTIGRAVSNLGLCASYDEGFVHFYDEAIEFAVSTKDILELAEVFKQYDL